MRIKKLAIKCICILLIGCLIGETAVANAADTMMPGSLAYKCSDGLIKDWIDIVNAHCNWSAMTSKVPTDKKGIPAAPTIFMVIGTTLAESGWNTSDWTPPTVLDFSNYPYNSTIEGVRYNLYTADSNLLRKHPELINRVYTKDYLKNGNYHTQYQFTKGFASVYPGGDTNNSNAKYPSRMNSPFMRGATTRTQMQTDAAFFPDQVSIMIQSAWERINSCLNIENVEYSMMNHMAYAAHNGGNGLLLNTWSVGGNPGGGYSGLANSREFGSGTSVWDSHNTYSKSDIATEAANDLLPFVVNASTYMLNSVGMDFYGEPVNNLTFNWCNHTDYEGLAISYLLASGQGFLASSTAMNRFRDKFANNAGFRRGAVIGYRLARTRYDASIDEVTVWANNLQVCTVDTTFYGDFYKGKQEKYKEIVVSMYCSDISVYNASGQGPRPTLHCFTGEALRGVFMSAIGAPYVYWKMLQQAGVNCTLGDAWYDGYGLLSASVYNRITRKS